MFKKLVLVITLIASSFVSHSQGCSDAGFCTMGAMKPGQGYNKKLKVKLRSLEVSYYRGKSTLTPVIYVTNIDASLSLTDNLGVQIKIPYQQVKGNFDNTSGLGDISLSLTQRLVSSEKFDISATLGGKIPSNKSDLKSSGVNRPLSKGLSLPMYYQTSLGSYDLVAGISLINKEWLFATGIQTALTSNDNSFNRAEWLEPVYPDSLYIWSYDKANNLKRGTDVMIRIERSFRFSNFNFNIGILPIWRISKDQRKDPDTLETIKMDFTTGLAFTVLGGFSYSFNTKSSLKLSYGHKLTDRKINPDGLTRHNVMIVAYLFRF
jgi:hypothetical protein